MTITIDETCSYADLDAWLEGITDLIEKVKAIRSNEATKDETIFIKFQDEIL